MTSTRSHIKTSARLVYDVSTPATFQLQIAVRPDSDQIIDEEHFRLFHNDEPVEKPEFSEDTIPQTGNRCHRFCAEPGRWRVEYDADVSPRRRETPVDDSLAPTAELPVEVLPYLNPSRYCESDRLGQQAAKQFGNMPRDRALVLAIEESVFQRTDYEIGSSTAQTTATDTWVETEGVCRDFAHLMITLCRALDIPARYTSGYLVDLQPPDFHAAVQVYVGGRWQQFDATRLAPLVGFVVIGTGHDAADVAFASFDGSVAMVESRVGAEYSSR